MPQVGALLRRYLDRFDVAQAFRDDDEVEHWLLSGQGKEVGGRRVEQVVWAYVVEVGFISFPSPSSRIQANFDPLAFSLQRTQQPTVSPTSSPSTPSPQPS